MSLMRIRIVLARTPEFPEGNSERGYEFVAPLQRDGHIDAEAWKTLRGQCEVVRFMDGERSAPGLLRHIGNGWRFDFNPERTEDDEPLFKLDRHPLLPGKYVSVAEDDGVTRPFRVLAVTPFVKEAAA
jgi:hypothetical protein